MQTVAAGMSHSFTSTDNNFFLTGVQMEIGSQATNFEHRSFGEELALCQRYFRSLGRGPDYYTMLNLCCRIAKYYLYKDMLITL